MALPLIRATFAPSLNRTPLSSCIFGNSAPISPPSVFSKGFLSGATTVTSSPRVFRLEAASIPMKLAPMTTAPRLFGGGDDRVRVREAAQRQDVLQIASGDLQGARLAARRHEQRIVSELPAAFERDGFCLRVNSHDFLVALNFNSIR